MLVTKRGNIFLKPDRKMRRGTMKNTIRILAIVVVLSVIWLVARGPGGCSVEPVPVTLESDSGEYANAEIYGSGYLGAMPSSATNNKYSKTVQVPLIMYPGEITTSPNTRRVDLTVICSKKPTSPGKTHSKHTHVIIEITGTTPPPTPIPLDDDPK